MNIVLFILLAAAVYIGFVQFKRSKEEVKEAPPQEVEPDRVSAQDKMKAARMQNFWSHQCRKIYKEINKI